MDINSLPKAESDVVIAGAGPVGLALALDLGRQGINCVVLDGEVKEEGERPNKRANAINTRAMEYMRRIGVSGRIHDAVSRHPHLTRDVAFVTSLTGIELFRFVDAFESSPEPPARDLSPEEYLRIDQDEIAAILRAEIAMLDCVRIDEGWRFVSLSQNRDGVEIVAHHLKTGAQQKRHGRYLVGCDGGASDVRKQAGIGFDGEGGLEQNINISFISAELNEVNIHPVASMYWIVNPDINGYAGGNLRSWRLTLFSVSPEEEAAIRAAPQYYINLLAGRPVSAQVTSIDRWAAHHLVVRSYSEGRIFLAGDAAHLHPPTGGLGMNTGLGDVSNLGWKLAAVIKGWAGEALLPSYGQERQPIGKRVVSQSNHQYNLRPIRYWTPDLLAQGPVGDAARAHAAKLIEEEKGTEFFSRGLVLGQTYDHSTVVIGDGTPTLNTQVIPYTPTAQPGARLPHVLLASGSIYDALAADKMTLLAAEGDAASKAIVKDAEKHGIPLKRIVIDQALANFYGAACLLVRPDGHVAWRGNEALTEVGLLQVAGRI